MDDFRDFFEDDTRNLVNEYERMRREGEEAFFDNEEFELIIDHYFALNEFDKGIEVTNKALEQHPYDVSFICKKVQFFFCEERYGDAIDELERALLLEPSNFELFLLMAMIYRETGDLDRSRKCYLSAERRAPGKDEVYFLEACIYGNCDKLEKALFSLKKCLTFNPENNFAIQEFMITCELLEKEDEAMKFYEQFIARDPYAEKIWYNLGMIYSRFNKNKKALQAYEYVTLINPDMPEAYVCLGKLYLEANKVRKALHAFNSYLKYKNANEDLYCEIGNCHQLLLNNPKARHFYYKALQMDPECIEGWLGLGLTYITEGHFRKAISFFKKAIRLDEGTPDAWYALADCYAQLNEYTRCVDAYERVIDEDPINRDVWIDYGRFLIRHDRFNELKIVMSEGLTLNPDYEHICYFMCGHCFARGKYDEAMDYYNMGASIDEKASDLVYDYFPVLLNNPDVVSVINNLKK